MHGDRGRKGARGKGDLAAANIRLALANLERVPSSAGLNGLLDAAATLLDTGAQPEDLLKALDGGDELVRTYNPNELRVPGNTGPGGGQWTRGGAAVPATPLGHGDANAVIQDVQYRGYYHDFFVKDLLNGLAENGSATIDNVAIVGVDGVSAIADGASRPKNGQPAYFIDAKTGLNPSFTKNQIDVYSLVCTGGHAISNDPRIRELGLEPGVPLPPMDIMIVRTLGPGEKVYYKSFCEDFLLWNKPNGP